jgi:dipeptidyl aminopeptidase/acylaminoacyl peptidase
MTFILTVSLLAFQAKSSLPAPTVPPLNENPVLAQLESKAGLRFDDMFPRRGINGKTARGLKWSPDDRYLAYLWNPIDDRGSDLWLYDTKSGESKRLTSPQLMSAFDRDALKAVERYRKEDEEWQKVDLMNDLEYRELRLKRKEEDAKRREPQANYNGISEVNWSPKSDEILMTFKGDVYRWKLGEAKPERLTKTKDNESQPKYTPAADGFTYSRGGSVYRVKFNSPIVEQLNPDLPNNLPVFGYNISPDGKKLLINGGRDTGQDRQIQYISYRDRFAKAVTTGRGVSDDEFKNEQYLFVYDISANDDPTKPEQKPWEVWKWAGGKEWQELSLNERAWSADSKKVVFATWKRIQKDFAVVVADLEKKELKTIYKAKPDGEHGTPGMADPFFTPDGTKVITMLDASGYRHAWMLDPATEGATQITKGEYEAYPQRVSPDGKTLFVTANKEHQARNDLYAVNMADFEMKRLTKQDGFYTEPAISDSTKQIAAQFRNWSNLTETFVMDGGEKRITTSHRSSIFERNNKVKPSLFTFKNRHGQTIHGFMFKPADMKPNEKRPLMIYVYGGPLGTGKSVEDGSLNTTAYWFNQYLTRVMGYVTVTIDTRGQSGYGNVFGKANFEQPGIPQTEDLSDCAKFLIQNHGVDPKKVALNGWSFGGFQTQMCMYSAPDVFTLGIAGAGPTEWQNYNTWYTTGVIGAVPNGKPEDLDKYSLTYLAKNLRSPLLLLHGMEDDNVLFQDTVNVYRKLLQYGRGPLVELALDPTGGHGMGGDMDSRDRHAIYLAFIQKWWGPYIAGK